MVKLAGSMCSHGTCGKAYQGGIVALAAYSYCWLCSKICRYLTALIFLLTNAKEGFAKVIDKNAVFH